MNVPLAARHALLPAGVVFYLRLVTLIECVGLAGRYLFSRYEVESDVYGWLYFDQGRPESVALAVDNFGMVAVLLCSGVILFGAWSTGSMHHIDIRSRRQFRIEAWATFTIAAWMVTLSVAEMMRASVYAYLTLAEHAVRFAAPLSLFVILRRVSKGEVRAEQDVVRVPLVILTMAAAATFAAHGLKAVQGYGPFTDLILISNLRWSNLALDQTRAEGFLFVIGVVDVILAGLLLVTRSRYILGYMAFWGLVTAASRMTAFGIDAWPETLIRAANAGVPLTIGVARSQLCCSRLSARSDSPHSAIHSPNQYATNEPV